MDVTIFDTETTGLIENRSVKIDRQPSVIEFYGAVVNLRTGKVKRELEVLIKPPQPVSEEITKITTITNEMLKDREPFSASAGAIFKFLSSGKLVIAHNASFDKEMIDIEAERLKHEMRWPRLLCTVEQSLHFKGFRMSLSALYEHLFDEKFVGAHRAKADVAALIRCCVEMHKRRCF